MKFAKPSIEVRQAFSSDKKPPRKAKTAAKRALELSDDDDLGSDTDDEDKLKVYLSIIENKRVGHFVVDFGAFDVMSNPQHCPEKNCEYRRVIKRWVSLEDTPDYFCIHRGYTSTCCLRDALGSYRLRPKGGRFRAGPYTNGYKKDFKGDELIVFELGPVRYLSLQAQKEREEAKKAHKPSSGQRAPPALVTITREEWADCIKQVREPLAAEIVKLQNAVKGLAAAADAASESQGQKLEELSKKANQPPPRDSESLRLPSPGTPTPLFGGVPSIPPAVPHTPGPPSYTPGSVHVDSHQPVRGGPGFSLQHMLEFEAYAMRQDAFTTKLRMLIPNMYF